MNAKSGADLVPARVSRVLPFRDSAAVVLVAEGKSFLIYVGLNEASAIVRELQGERPDRPLTHDLLAYVLTGFDIAVTNVVVSSIVNGVFCATVVLAQSRPDGTRAEVRLDARASDSLVLALKSKAALLVTRRVLDEVEDVASLLSEIDTKLAELAAAEAMPSLGEDDDEDDDPPDEDDAGDGETPPPPGTDAPRGEGPKAS